METPVHRIFGCILLIGGLLPRSRERNHWRVGESEPDLPRPWPHVGCAQTRCSSRPHQQQFGQHGQRGAIRGRPNDGRVVGAGNSPSPVSHIPFSNHYLKIRILPNRSGIDLSAISQQLRGAVSQPVRLAAPQERPPGRNRHNHYNLTSNRPISGRLRMRENRHLLPGADRRTAFKTTEPLGMRIAGAVGVVVKAENHYASCFGIATLCRPTMVQNPGGPMRVGP